jgi:hypothetical protein
MTAKLMCLSLSRELLEVEVTKELLVAISPKSLWSLLKCCLLSLSQINKIQMFFEDDELESSNSMPFLRLHSQEFIDGALKAGSLISMLENKKINTTTLFALLVENPSYQKFFTEITASSSFKEALFSLLQLNPSLVKSKIVKSLARKLNGKSKSANGPRKAHI